MEKTVGERIKDLEKKVSVLEGGSPAKKDLGNAYEKKSVKNIIAQNQK